jgi:hypothetical protein
MKNCELPLWLKNDEDDEDDGTKPQKPAHP